MSISGQCSKGTESGVLWGVIVTEDSGDMTFAAGGDKVGFRLGAYSPDQALSFADARGQITPRN
jgi:hypothetical protein